LIFAGHPRRKAHGAEGLLFDLLGHFSAGEDPMAIEGTENCLEAALIRP